MVRIGWPRVCVVASSFAFSVACGGAVLPAVGGDASTLAAVVAAERVALSVEGMT